MIPNLDTHQQNVDDPVEEMLKKTGCMELHYEVQVLTLLLYYYIYKYYMYNYEIT